MQISELIKKRFYYHWCVKFFWFTFFLILNAFSITLAFKGNFLFHRRKIVLIKKFILLNIILYIPSFSYFTFFISSFILLLISSITVMLIEFLIPFYYRPSLFLMALSHIFLISNNLIWQFFLYFLLLHFW